VGETKEVATYCRICEPQCGLIASVEDGVLVEVRGDSDHPHSQGFKCTKSSAAIEIAYDPDRVIYPLKRIGEPGEFKRVSWDEALDDIAARLMKVRRDAGPEAFGVFLGNPPAFGYGCALGLAGFKDALKVKWRYSVNAEDAASRLVANALLYGSVALLPKPDLWRTQFALLIGANPIVSHGSLVTEARFREALDSIVDRDGRVVVIDPRRSETARRYEHLPVQAGSDAYLLLGLLNVVIAEDLVDRRFITEWTTGFADFAQQIAAFTPEVCEGRCRVPASTIRETARAFATASSAVVYGRTGTCTQRFGTLNNILQDALMILTGNIERRGGLIFGGGAIDFAKFAMTAGFATLGAFQARTTGLPEVFGMLPSTSLATDITVPGPGQVRALAVVGGNPVLSSPRGGPILEQALDELDLHFSVDLYINETNKHADYILPCVGQYERDDVPLIALGNMLRPAIWATERVIDPIGEARNEFDIFDDLARRVGCGGAYSQAPLRWLARAGLRIQPRTMADVLIRTSAVGDWFGLRRNGVSFRKLVRDHPHGMAVTSELPIGHLGKILRTPDRKIPLGLAAIRSELRRMLHHVDDDNFPLRLHGLRETRSHNTWMHNTKRTMPANRRFVVQINPTDGTAAGLVDGGRATITSASGSVTVPVVLTPDMSPGNIAMPHGWGHSGGWQRANTAGGVNSNILSGKSPEDFERLAGMSILNGIPVRIAPATDELKEDA